MWDSIARIILRNRIIFLAALIAITAFMGWKATKVELSYEGAKILPPDLPLYHDYLEFKKNLR